MLSKHFTRQSSFIGSRRYIRGQVIRLLSETPQLCVDDLQAKVQDERLQSILNDLEQEGMIKHKSPGLYSL